ncbi:MAG: helicase-associated domain-containing protein, partial [Acidimicrobiales bacterium]
LELAAICKRLGIKPPANKAAILHAIAAHVGHPERVRELAAAGPPGTVQVLERALRDHGVVDASPYTLTDRAPAGWLARRGLLGAYEWYRLIIPGEVGLALRGGHAFGSFWPDEPEVPTEPADADVADAAGAEQALRVVADVAVLLEGWAADPPRLLKDGGVGVRDVRRAARATERSERDVARLLDIAGAAGLAWVDERAGVALPTAAFDEWLELDAPARWGRLAGGWLAAEFDPSVAGALDAKDKRIPPLLRRHSASAADRRQSVLRILAGVPGDRAVPAGPALWARARWSRPQLWRTGPAPPEMLASWVVEEAELLGLRARGSLTGAGRRAVAGDLAGAVAALAQRAPASVDHFVVQADLTVVAPGALQPQVAAELELLADVESRGAATVYRIGEHTLRRAFDAGRSAA